MPLINTSLPNLIQGVSQQPDAVRYNGQCEEQENALSSVVDGLTKRPNTRFIATIIQEALSNDAKVHFIDRNDDEKYVVILNTTGNINDGYVSSIRAFNLITGVEATVTGEAGGALDVSYIDDASPRSSLRTLTVADNTFVVNRNTTVNESSSTTPAYGTQAFVFVKQVANSHFYGVQIKASGKNNDALTKYDIQSNSSGGTSNAIRDQLYADLNGGAGGTLSSFTVTKSGNHGLLVELGDVDGEISVFNEAGDNTNYLGVVWREVSAITDLPEYCVADLVVKVVGDVELNQDDYYVKFRTSDGGSEGVGTWEETSAPNISTGLDSSTMPHTLINTGYNTFEFGPLSHGQREAGDDDANPHPSFVGNKIEDAFFYKNRLGYLSGSNVVMSESGEFFNHYRLTVLDLLDSAPIDVAASSAAVSTFRSAVGFQENLILFTDDSQFVLKGADILTPKTVSINPATRYNVNKSVRPLALGSYLYFPSEQTSFAGVREFIVNTDSSNYDSVDITEHVPAYIPRDVRIFTGNTTTNHLVVGSANEPNVLYVYTYFWSGTQKVVSAWSKFTFNADIIGASFIDDVLYLITVDDTATHLVSLPFSNPKDEAGFTTYLDNRQEVTVDSGGATVTVSSVAGSDTDNFAIYTQDGLKLNTTGSPVSVPESVLGYGVNNGVGIASIYRFYLDPAGGSSSTFTYHTTGANFATQTVYGAVLVSNPTNDEAFEAVTNVGPITAPPSSLRYTLGQAQPEGTKLWTGHQYNMKYTFSELIFKAAAGNSKSPSNAAKLKVRNGSLFYNDSASFKVSVTPLYRDTYENVFTPNVVGSTTIGELNLDSGSYRFPIFSDAQGTKITITNDSALPSNFTSAEFESFVHTRSSRYAS